MDLKGRFEDAAKRVRGLPTASPDQLLKLYGLYKQGCEGDVKGKRPGMLDIKGRAKYDAWASRAGMSGQQAMEEYVKYVDQLLGG
jgi:diazepam-binding inhibitor (GABA receptor modulating acyl-CoA-binding protein)